MITDSMQQKNNLKVNLLFYSMLLFSLIGYLGFYIYSLENKINVIFQYSNYDWDGISVVSKVIRFAKDGLVCVLAVFLFAKSKKNAKLTIGYGIFIFCGIAIACINGIEPNILAGIRCYLYFYVLVMISVNQNIEDISLPVIRKIIYVCLVVNFCIILSQAWRGTEGNFSLAGQGGYRFTGLFGGSNGCATFALAVLLLTLICDSSKYCHKVNTIVIIIFSFVCCFMTGCRSSLINMILIVLCYMVDNLNIKESAKRLIMLCGALICIPVVIGVVSSMIGRGNILQVQLESGRLSILKNFFLDADEFQIIFGRGIGIGSTADTLMRELQGEQGMLMDGTFNLLFYQYGIVGVLLFVVFLLKLYKTLRRESDFVITCMFMGTVIMQCLTCNVFESYAFLILMFVAFWVITKPKNLKGVNSQCLVFDN